jgi:septal ring factor EnvC (AmiA/AmiB activator)
MGGLKLRLAAEKIAAHQSSAAAISQLEVALHQAENKVYDLVRDLEVAEKNLEEGPAKSVEWLLAEATGKPPGPAIDMNHLRAAVADARERLDIQRDYRGRLSATLGKARTDAGWTEQHVKDAALEVLKTTPNIATLIAEIETLQEKLVDKGRELSELVSLSVVASRDEGNQPTHARDIDNRFYTPPASWNALLKAKPPENLWKNALSALCQDANAPLPE